MSKACTKCGEWKKNGEFGAHKRSADRLKYACKACECAAVKAAYDPEKRNAYNREYYAANRLKERKRSRLKRYSLTEEEYAALWDTHNGLCAVCNIGLLDVGDYETGNNRPANAACIDHCHTSGQVRGLLCIPCNLMLGYAKDSTEVLTNAITYLKDRHNEGRQLGTEVQRR